MTSAPFAAARAAQRARLIKLIHVARRDLDMADDAYRAVVADLTSGKTSSADCSVPQLERIIDHLKKAGFKVRKPKTAKPTETRPMQTDPESRKLRAVWLLLHEIGVTTSNSEASLAAYVKRMAGVDDLRFTRGADKYRVIEGLKAWAARELPAAITTRLAALQAAGTIPAELTEANIRAVVCPTLNPRTFDALRQVWTWLDGRAAGNPNAVAITPLKTGT